MTDIEKVFYVFDREEEYLEDLIKDLSRKNYSNSVGAKKSGGRFPWNLNKRTDNIERILKEIRSLRKNIEAHLKLDI